MNIFQAFSPFITSWRDPIEILLLSITIYYISIWFKKDAQKNLLPYFYGFCSFTITVHVLGLSTISYCLFLFSPAIIFIFMFMHQSVLQRNLIALKNITLAHSPSDHWITTLLRASLTMMHANKRISIVIECSDALAPYITADYCINAPLSKDLLTLLVEHTYNPKQMIWVDAQGTIRGINASWKTKWHQEMDEHDDAWINDALTYTSKNDALVLHSNPTNHQYSLVSNGNLDQALTINEISQLLRKKINRPLSVTKKGYTYGIARKKNNMAQHLS